MENKDLHVQKLLDYDLTIQVQLLQDHVNGKASRVIVIIKLVTFLNPILSSHPLKL